MSTIICVMTIHVLGFAFSNLVKYAYMERLWVVHGSNRLFVCVYGFTCIIKTTC